jgi:deoxyadenosine/deoxycytidine kinase
MEKGHFMHCAVAGNIGSGKTTLTNMLAKHYRWNPSYEVVENNPYLASFYQDMQRWSFNLQVYFLNKRFRQVLDIRKKKSSTIQDRTIYEDACIFAPNLHDMGLMATRDFENYTSLYELMVEFLQYPDLLIYLKADTSTLVSQIQKRGREYEHSIRIDYLQNLNVLYEKWINNYSTDVVQTGKGKLLTVDVNTCKFAENPEDFGQVIDLVNGELFGLFQDKR